MRATAPEPDPYLVLGVARTATAAEIRAAYRALGAKYHPDRHQGNPLEELASAKMAEINHAYEILSDPARRATADGGGARGGGAGAAAPQGTDGGFARAAAGPDGRRGRRLVQIVALLSCLPLVIRFGGLIARGVTALVRELVAGAALLRGTPFAAGAISLAAVILIAALLRRRRRRQATPRSTPRS